MIITEVKFKEKIDFPMLMFSKVSGNIVLFFELGKGTIVYIGNDNKDWKFGQYVTGWSMSNFEPFFGEITLTND